MTKTIKENKVNTAAVTQADIANLFKKDISATISLGNMTKHIGSTLNLYFFNQYDSLETKPNMAWFDVDLQLDAANKKKPHVAVVRAVRYDVLNPMLKERGLINERLKWASYIAAAKESYTQDLRTYATPEAIKQAEAIEAKAEAEAKAETKAKVIYEDEAIAKILFTLIKRVTRNYDNADTNNKEYHKVNNEAFVTFFDKHQKELLALGVDYHKAAQSDKDDK